MFVTQVLELVRKFHYLRMLTFILILNQSFAMKCQYLFLFFFSMEKALVLIVIVQTTRRRHFEFWE